jgi:hypothetical protein
LNVINHALLDLRDDAIEHLEVDDSVSIHWVGKILVVDHELDHALLHGLIDILDTHQMVGTSIAHQKEAHKLGPWQTVPIDLVKLFEDGSVELMYGILLVLRRTERSPGT